MTVSRETIEKLRRVQDLMRHAVPNGDPAVIFDRALTVLLEQLARTKQAATDQPREGRELTPGSRHVPAHVPRAVWARDGDQCAFVSAHGRRCTERGFLELHHTAPYAAGGIASVATIELRCRAHNQFEAQLDFGPSVRQRRCHAGSTKQRFVGEGPRWRPAARRGVEPHLLANRNTLSARTVARVVSARTS